MMDKILVYLVGLLGGVAVGVQSPIAGKMGQSIGGTAGSFIVHLGGLIFSGLLLIFRGGENIRDWHKLPWYAFFAGAFGLILYLTINYTLPRLGSTMMIMLIIVGQLLMGMLVDHFGWFGVDVRPIDLPKIAGVLLLFAGGFLISR
jgi:transporter family-2 protein